MSLLIVILMHGRDTRNDHRPLMAVTVDSTPTLVAGTILRSHYCPPRRLTVAIATGSNTIP